jgi:CheY-like chemotaxis protein
VYDGAAALALAREWKPSAVVLDIGLPGKDGYAVAREMRALPGLEAALLVALTGYGGDEDRERARQAGFDTLQVKPVEPQKLEAILEDHFKSAVR